MDLKKAIEGIHWLGHDTFRLEGSKILYFDPYQVRSSQKADLILITHEHFDHCSPEDVAKIQKEDTVIVTDAASAKKLTGDIRIVAPGDKVEIQGTIIEVMAAYNTNKNFHPKKAGMLSFLVSLDEIRYFHAGDTDVIPEMEAIQTDIAFLPVSGTYVMTADEAVGAARMISPKVAIPMHYGAIVGSEEDAVKFKKALEKEMQVIVLPQESS